MILSNINNLPQPFVDAVTREYKYTPKRYSVTALLCGLRETILKRRHDEEIAKDVSDMIWLIFGTAIHSVLENGKETDTQLKENKLAFTFPNGYTLSGIFDLYDESTQTVTDYKSGTVWKVIYGDWEDYRKQCLAYCFLLEKIGFKARFGENIVLLKDWSQTKARTDSSYPKFPVHKQLYRFTDEDLVNFEKEAEARFIEIEKLENVPDNELPLCSDKERWAEPTTWAVMKEGRKSAVKVCKTLEEAENLLATLDSKHYIEERKGLDKKCVNYCDVCEFCNYWKEKYQEIKEEVKKDE